VVGGRPQQGTRRRAASTYKHQVDEGGAGEWGGTGVKAGRIEAPLPSCPLAVRSYARTRGVVLPGDARHTGAL